MVVVNDGNRTDFGDGYEKALLCQNFQPNALPSQPEG